MEIDLVLLVPLKQLHGCINSCIIIVHYPFVFLFALRSVLARLFGLRLCLALRVPLPLELLDSLLLFLIRLFVLTAFLCRHLFEVSVVPAVVIELLLIQVHDVCADVVEKLLIVRHNQQSFLPLRQVIVQPDHGVEVKMVRGLVQEQKGRLDKECACERHAHSPPTRKVFSAPPLHLRGKPETCKNSADATFSRMCSNRVEFFIHFGELGLKPLRVFLLIHLGQLCVDAFLSREQLGPPHVGSENRFVRRHVVCRHLLFA
mmetsp:Transcript_24983/g.65129  ORF Transcript_24983/g.65129 Transcript_24983/m.65129 type:complete len:260 (+) Transcript_24983:43-822(+)